MSDTAAEYNGNATVELPPGQWIAPEPCVTTDPVTWKAYPMAWVIIDAPTHGLASPRGARVRVQDEGGGPYLCVEFFNDEPYSDEHPNEGYFSNAGQIDRFANTLKDLLRAAEEADQ